MSAGNKRQSQCQIPKISEGETHLFLEVTTAQRFFLRSSLQTTVSNDFVRRVPGAHAPSGMNAKNHTHDRRLRINRTVEEKRFY